MIPLLGSLIGPAIKGLFSVVDQAVEDKDQAAVIKARLQEMALSGEMKHLEEAAANIRAEAQGDSWLQRNWRPLIMLSFGVIIVNNYILFPYLQLFFNSGAMLDIPPDMWELLKLGLGGYVIGRSAEKAVKHWKGKSGD